MTEITTKTVLHEYTLVAQEMDTIKSLLSVVQDLIQELEDDDYRASFKSGYTFDSEDLRIVRNFLDTIIENAEQGRACSELRIRTGE